MQGRQESVKVRVKLAIRPRCGPREPQDLGSCPMWGVSCRRAAEPFPDCAERLAARRTPVVAFGRAGGAVTPFTHVRDHRVGNVLGELMCRLRAQMFDDRHGDSRWQASGRVITRSGEAVRCLLPPLPSFPPGPQLKTVRNDQGLPPRLLLRFGVESHRLVAGLGLDPASGRRGLLARLRATVSTASSPVQAPISLHGLALGCRASLYGRAGTEFDPDPVLPLIEHRLSATHRE